MGTIIWKKYVITLPGMDESVADELIAVALANEDTCGWEQLPATAEGKAWAVYFESEKAPSDFPQTIAGVAEAFGVDQFRTDGPSDVLRENWNYNWRQFFRPVEIGRRFVVVPAWERAESSHEIRLPLYLEPGMAFGTGTHATTQLCMELAEDVPLAEAKVLDAGTGSGILCLAAHRLGAQHCLGTDIDPEVQENFEENMRINDVPPAAASLHIGPLSEIAEGSYDFAFCNMLSQEFLPLLADLASRMRKGGSIAFSGLLREEEDEITHALEKHGLKVVRSIAREEWCALLTTQS